MNNYPAEYINRCRVAPDFRITVLQRMEASRPALHEMLATDPFIEALQKTFNAEILIEKRKKHMIIIHNPEATTNTQIMLIKKWFEVDQVIDNWNGIDRVDEKQKTALITKTPPPYKVPYTHQVLSMEQTKELE